MLIRLGEVPEIDEPSNDLVMRPLVDAASGDGDLSVTWVRLSGRHRRLRTDCSTRVYYVLEGEGTFELDGETEAAVVTGDVVVVPRGVAYALAGDLTYLVVNGPAFRAGDDVYE